MNWQELSQFHCVFFSVHFFEVLSSLVFEQWCEIWLKEQLDRITGVELESRTFGEIESQTG